MRVPFRNSLIRGYCLRPRPPSWWRKRSRAQWEEKTPMASTTALGSQSQHVVSKIENPKPWLEWHWSQSSETKFFCKLTPPSVLLLWDWSLIYAGWELCFGPSDISPISNRFPHSSVFSHYNLTLLVPTLSLTWITVMLPVGLLGSISLCLSLPPLPAPPPSSSWTHTQSILQPLIFLTWKSHHAMTLFKIYFDTSLPLDYIHTLNMTCKTCVGLLPVFFFGNIFHSRGII